MPTNRRLRTRALRAEIDPVLWAALNDEPPPADGNPIVALDISNYDAMEPLWREHRAAILARWIHAKPGTRPAMWWRYDAPRLAPELLGRWARTVYAPRLIETRRLLRGNGKPLHEALLIAPAHDYGIPVWFGDPDSPPLFEPQHAYLMRQGLLRPAERRAVAEPFPHPLRIEPAKRWGRGSKL